MRLSIYTFIILFAVGAVFIRAQDEEDKSTEELTKLTKKKKKDRSTSSSSGAEQTGESAADSLEMNSSGDSSDSGSKKKRTKKPSYIPKSSEERQGWRKWHRKCTRCPEDMKKKWRDFSIKWICGEYQRAKRSFKSRCMMEYRNCQDGTMFVKVADHRCLNQSRKEAKPRGDHFFYEYRVKMSYESSNSKASSSSDETDESKDSY